MAFSVITIITNWFSASTPSATVNVTPAAVPAPRPETPEEFEARRNAETAEIFRPLYEAVDRLVTRVIRIELKVDRLIEQGKL